MKKILMFVTCVLFTASVYGQEDKAITQRLKEKYGFVCYHDTNGGWYSIKKGDYHSIGNEGACDLRGCEVIPPIWDDVMYGGTYYKVKKNGKVGIRGLNNEVILPINKYDDILYHQMEEYHYCEVKIGGKVGIIDKQSKEIVPCKYDGTSCYQLKDYDYCEVKLNGKLGIIDKQGKEFVPCKYDDTYCHQFKDYDYCEVKMNGKVGIIDKQGKEIVPCKYDDTYIWQFKDGNYCTIEVEGKWGVIDKSGKEVLSCGQYEYIRLYKSQYLPVSKGIEIRYGDYHKIEEIVKNGKWGVYDLKTGKEVVPCQYDYVGSEEEGIFAFNKEGRYNGNKIDEISGGKWGFVDITGKEIVSAQYESVSAFTDGVAQVKKDGVVSMLPHPLKGATVKMSSVSISVDTNIPVMNNNNENTFAFVIANENYAHFTGADFSINDGKVFSEYCKKTLGIPENNVRYYEDATYGNMVNAVKKLQDIADVYEGDAKIIFYYSGLGATDEKSMERYILPTDASLSALNNTGYSVTQLLKMLNELNVVCTWVILDAPFSNVDKKGNTLASTRGVALKPRSVEPEGYTIVCQACQDGQTAYSHKQYGHSLFTFALLEKLQQTKGICTLKDLSDYASNWVKKTAMSTYDKMQTPTAEISEKLRTEWNNIKL